MAFDPDKYLESKLGGSNSFNPDAYLQAKLGSKTPQMPVDANTPSPLQSGAEGAAEGATLGLKPIIAGASGTLMDTLTGVSPPSDILERYRQLRDAETKRQEEAKSTNPKSFLAGELAGGLAGGAALSGPAQGASLLEKLKASGLLGAKLGATSGFATSKGDLTKGDVGQVAQDTGIGALAGGTLAPAGTAAIEGVGALAGKLAPKLTKAFNMGTEGDNIVTQAGRNQITDVQRPQVASDIADQLGGLKSDLGKQFESLKQQYGNKEISVDDFQSKLQDLIKTLDSRIPEEANNRNTLTGLIDNFIPGDKSSLPAQDLMKLKRGLQNYSPFQKGMSSVPGENVAGKSAEALGETLEQNVPGLEKANKDYSNLQENVLDKLGVKDTNPRDTIEKLQRVLFNKNNDSMIGSDTRVALGDAMSSLKEINPDLSKQISDQVIQMSDKLDITRSATNSPMPTGGNILKTAKGYGLQATNAVGLGTKALTSFPKESLAKIGQSLSTSDSELSQKLGSILVEASQKDDIGRNALMFTLSQNSAYRDLINKMLLQK